MKKSVKWFLVQRFLLILFCIYWSVEAVNFLYRVVIIPAARAFLKSQQTDDSSNDQNTQRHSPPAAVER